MYKIVKIQKVLRLQKFTFLYPPSVTFHLCNTGSFLVSIPHLGLEGKPYNDGELLSLLVEERAVNIYDLCRSWKPICLHHLAVAAQEMNEDAVTENIVRLFKCNSWVSLF